jgi:hypothetical protein
MRHPTFVKVYFDLPFVLFLRDSLRDVDLEAWASAYSEGRRPLPYARYAPAGEKPGFMAIGGRFPVFLPSGESAPLYEVRVRNFTVGIRTLRRVNPHRDTVLMGELPGDRTGRASFSSVLVIMRYADLEEANRDNPEYSAQVAVDAVNHLVDHYRVIADRPWVSHVTCSVIQEFRIFRQYDDGPDDQMEFGSGSGPLEGFGGALDEALETQLRAAVAQEQSSDFVSRLDADIRDHLDLQEWRLAIIQSAVLFEAWLSSFIRRRFATKGLAANVIDDKFINARGLPKSATALASQVVNEATGFDFEGTPHFASWAADVRDPRNELVHGKRSAASRVEATAAYSATIAAIKLLDSV